MRATYISLSDIFPHINRVECVYLIDNSGAPF